MSSLAIGRFIEQVRGYQLKEFLAQSPVEEETLAMVSAGCTLATGGEERTSVDPNVLKEIIEQPYVIYLRREKALLSHGSWAGSMFMYEHPRVGFANSQQKLLIAALRGGTDEDLAEELDVSLSAVKKAWQSIYAKTEAAGVQSSNDHEWAERGKERKRTLLNYVRAHPEELRPVDRKLMPSRVEQSSREQRKAVMSRL
ncbi:MAG TPA: hypothetical protein VH350_02570 [Candidatus Sulfotelmatobacter sp.]|nr:hypothetical protein [Candidatus Sulfotelmatobacter sp.]